MELESHGNSIEGALCAYDIENGRKLNDNDAISIIELLIDINTIFKTRIWVRSIR